MTFSRRMVVSCVRIDQFVRTQLLSSDRSVTRTPGRSCEDDIKMDLKEMEWDGVGAINLAKSRHTWWSVVNTAVIFFGGGDHNTLGIP